MNDIIDKLKPFITNMALGVLFGLGLYLIFVPEAGIVNKRKTGLSFRDVKTYQSQVQNAVNLRQKQVELENYNSAPDLNRPNAKSNDVYDQNVEAPERNEGVLDNDSGTSLATSTTLESRINRFEHIKQKYEELAEIEKQKYLQAFKKEAQQLGYEIEVDDSLNITSIKSKKAAGPGR